MRNKIVHSDILIVWGTFHHKESDFLFLYRGYRKGLIISEKFQSLYNSRISVIGVMSGSGYSHNIIDDTG